MKKWIFIISIASIIIFIAFSIYINSPYHHSIGDADMGYLSTVMIPLLVIFIYSFGFGLYHAMLKSRFEMNETQTKGLDK